MDRVAPDQRHLFSYIALIAVVEFVNSLLDLTMHQSLCATVREKAWVVESSVKAGMACFAERIQGSIDRSLDILY